MCRRKKETVSSSHNPVFESLASDRRRDVLRALLDRSRSGTEQELTTLAAVTERRPAATDVTTADLRIARSELVHIHLPKLEYAGLIVWNRGTGSVETTSHPAFEDPRFRLLLEVDTPGLDEVLSNLANERRRVLLTHLRDEGTLMSRPALARDLLRHETGATDSERVEEVITALSHVHLPKLRGANLIEYDRETGRAAYSTHPSLEAVFTIIYEPDTCLLDAYDDFLGGLKTAYMRLGRDGAGKADWPHAWNGTYHG